MRSPLGLVQIRYAVSNKIQRQGKPIHANFHLRPADVVSTAGLSSDISANRPGSVFDGACHPWAKMTNTLVH